MVKAGVFESTPPTSTRNVTSKRNVDVIRLNREEDNISLDITRRMRFYLALSPIQALRIIRKLFIMVYIHSFCRIIWKTLFHAMM